MPLPRPLLLACLLLLGLSPTGASAQAAPDQPAAAPGADAAKAQAEAERQEEEKFRAMARRFAAMPQVRGDAPLPEAKAALRLGEEYRFIGKEDATFILADIWRNPREALQGVQGIIVPAAFDPFAESAWCVVVSYEKCGYVKDDDAAEIDAAKLLEAFHEHETEINEARKKRGYGELWCVDWAEAPRYDKARHIIFWAKRLSGVRGGTDHDTLNYDARCLGRRGLLSLNAVANMRQLPEIKRAMEGIIPLARFDAGETYADFDAGSDHVAEFTVLGLVAAGAAAKLLGKGAFLLILVKFGKFLIIPFVLGWRHVAGGARWLWRKATGRETGDRTMANVTKPAEVPPPDQPPTG